jgi:hypothetical protein
VKPAIRLKAQYVKARDLADMTGFTPRYFTELAATGRIPGAHQPTGTGGAWRFDLSKFREWWNSTESKVSPIWQASTNEGAPIGARYSGKTEFSDSPLKQRVNQRLNAVLGSGKRT